MRIERVVIDTNVLISAALSPGSAPAQIVDCLILHATLVFSQQTFEEFETRLWRPKFDRYIDIERRNLLLHDLSAIADWVTVPDMTGTRYSRDPDDDVFVHTALAGKVDWLVSGDRDLLELPMSPDWNFQIFSPAQALQLWSQGQQI